MRPILICLAILTAGCKGAAGPAGPSGSNGVPGDAIPTLQMVFRQGVLPDSNYMGVMMLGVRSNNPTNTYLNDGTIGLSMTPSGLITRVLMKWDLSQYIPSSAIITNAVLQVDSLDIGGSGNAVTLGVFELECDWNATACWQYSYDTNDWDACGGATPDHALTRGYQYPQDPMDTVVLADIDRGINKLIAFNLDRSMVQRWLSEPGVGKGLVITSVNEWADSEIGAVILGNPTSATQYRPTLIVNYYIP